MQERERSDTSGIDISVFDPLPDQLNAGRLSDPGEEDQELRIRGRNITQDLFSDMSSVASPNLSPQVVLTPPPASPLQQSILIEDLNLSESESSEDEGPKKVKVANVTSSSHLEDQLNAAKMNDVSRLGEKMRNRLIHKKLKPVPYLPPSTSSSSDSSQEEEQEMEEVELEVEKPKERSKLQIEEDLKNVRKSGLKPGIIKKVFESYSNFRTPINFQILDKTLGQHSQWHVTLSDGKGKHVFIMSSKYDKIMPKIRNNTIICLNQIYNMKEKKGEPKQKKKVLLITNFFVPTAQQVDYQVVGLPKTLHL